MKSAMRFAVEAVCARHALKQLDTRADEGNRIEFGKSANLNRVVDVVKADRGAAVVLVPAIDVVCPQRQAGNSPPRRA